MFFISPTMFVILLVVGLLCAVGTLITSAWYKDLANPTPAQSQRHRFLFYAGFAGFLAFFCTPIFLWLLLTPV